MTSESTSELVRRAQAEEPGALEALCDEWLPTVLGWTLRLGGPKVDAEDAAHDVFVVVFRRLGKLREAGAFSSWLFGVTRRVVAAHRRRAWVRHWIPGAVPDGADPAPGPGERVEHADVTVRVWAAIDTLPPHQREVLVLCDLEERPDSEVAAMLGVPKNTVKSRLRRARAALRDEVAELWLDPEHAGPAVAEGPP
ncbi:MAG: sigma-70 family RNA polymerase sigma factor [Myxococcales bacterium]|nr:sigma-70 family RNA polymerase sigma factor [Myxococcales bacterium]